jgi:hypothetical protein
LLRLEHHRQTVDVAMHEPRDVSQNPTLGSCTTGACQIVRSTSKTCLIAHSIVCESSVSASNSCYGSNLMVGFSVRLLDIAKPIFVQEANVEA